MIIGLLCATIAALPLLVPRGPGNTAPVDAFAVLFLVLAIAAAITSRRRVTLPAIVPVVLITTISAIAVMFSLHPGTGLLNLLIEFYLAVLLWAVCHELRGRPDRLLLVAKVWVGSSAFWALLLIGTQYHFLPHALENLLLSYDSSSRVSAAAHNPNLAASYVVTSLFVLLASPVPRMWLLRAGLGAWLGWAVFVTASNGAILGTALGLGVLGAAWVLRNSSRNGRIALAAGVIVIAGLFTAALVAANPTVNQTAVDQFAQSQRSGALKDDIGRLNDSVARRATIWGKAWTDGFNHSAIGVGPGEAQTIQTSDGGQLNKSLHNDYLAFLLERGIAGLLALLLLIGVVGSWCRRLTKTGSLRIDGWLWRPQALAAGCAANLAIAFTHESFHFRHVWLLLALTWVMSDLIAAQEPAAPARSRLRGLAPLAPLPVAAGYEPLTAANTPAGRREVVTHAAR